MVSYSIIERECLRLYYYLIMFLQSRQRYFHQDYKESYLSWRCFIGFPIFRTPNVSLQIQMLGRSGE